MKRVALITIVHGRHDHLLRQREALERAADAPGLHVIVAMDDPAVGALPQLNRPGVQVVEVARTPTDEGLPLARARNVGAAAAMAHGAGVLVFLDVDCLPAPGALEGYLAAATAPETRGRLLCGPVTYLPPAPPEGYDLDRLIELDHPHPARPAPAEGEVELGGPHELFWSLSFAVDTPTWCRIGGFSERYSGYGGEDTDFAFTARMCGIELAWIGSARAYHQHHAVEKPPVSHLDDILRNAAVFHERWGSWPMTGWLEEFERMGLVRHLPSPDRWVRTA